MRILFLINLAGGAGTEKYVDNLQRIFSSEGNSCFLGYNIEGKLSKTMKQRGIPCLKLGLTKFDVVKSPEILAEYCREHEIDVIHTQYPVENIIAIRSLKYYEKPHVVLTRHLSDYQGLKWAILNKIYTPKNHRIICVCDEARHNLIKCGVSPKQIRVIYNGIESNNLVKFNVAGDIFKLVICARYSQEKGLDFLLESLAELKKKTNKKFECRILGEGDEYKHIKKLIYEMNLNREVFQLGYVENVRKFLNESNLYLNTSRSGEAMSFAILEAMDCGLPIVATDVGGNSTLVERGKCCGKIVPFGDVEGFSNAILEYMNDSELLTEDGDAAQKKVKEDFDLVKLAHEVYDAYK